ncbi:DUF4401 domain-containing protein [Vibrio europaeus]|uniref:DUF4401 domain-containing protein n=1 Tax=Vibrio europaeus TaxID=300876 RepID=UPI00233F2CB2|nr:DUF4401 domain-containing protein [Vibrio europaeus]MDC5821380.1 DUF4401 domain-containing protein [Vibrio europaeus]MDC5868378.1 DUF4401 domain-containing protein [Vibrio europaeus]
MKNQLEVLWDKLSQANLVEGKQPSSDKLDSPWYIKVILGFSGSLAAFFLLGFLSSAVYFLFASELASIGFSLAMLGVAYWIFSQFNNPFHHYFALVMSLSAQLSFGVALFGLQSWTPICLIFALFQAILAVVMPNILHRVCSTVLALVALVASSTMVGFPQLLASVLIFPTVLLFINEFSLIGKYKWIRGVIDGVVIALLLLTLAQLFRADYEYLLTPLDSQLSVIVELVSYLIYGAGLVFAATELLKVYDIGWCSREGKFAILFMSLLALVTHQAPGIGVGVVVMLLGFAHSHRLLMGAGIAYLSLYAVMYYFTLVDTLLFKSMVLLALSGLMLLGRFCLNHVLSTNEGN